MDWTNKETKYVADLPEDWDNPKNNFTKVEREVRCLSGDVEDTWNEANQTWDIDAESNQNYIDRQTAIQNFVNSPFNNITIEQAGTYIDNNSNSLATANAVMKKMVEFTIGLREVLRETIKKSTE